jgi:hypothetical protein
MIMGLVVSKRDLQLDVDPKPRWEGSGILLIPRVLSVEGMRASVCEQKNLQADLIRDCECNVKAYNLLFISLNAFQMFTFR